MGSNSEMISVKGNVERVVYRADDSGWTVLAMDGQMGKFKAVGVFASVEVSDLIEMEGAWADHSRFGKQFKAERYSKPKPVGVQAIARWLQTIDGVGQVLASRIAEALGEEALDIIREDPLRVAQVEGISETKAASIVAAVKNRCEEDEVLLALQKLGIPAAAAGRVLHHVRRLEAGDPIGWVRADPYRIREVAGVGFKTADLVAGKLGIANDDPRRIRAGIVHALELAERNGDTAMTRSSVAREGGKLLSVRGALVDEQIGQMLDWSHKVTTPGHDTIRDSGGLIQRARYHDLERRLANLILRRGAEKLESIEVVGSDELELSDEQLDAVRVASSSKLAVMTGGPGTGKTTSTRAILRTLQQAGLLVKQAAPTGRAAQRMEEATGWPASTIHRLLEFREGRFSRHAGYPIDCDALILDEVSMLDVRLAVQVLEATPEDARVILVGDADQLPSVGPGRVLLDIIESGKAPVARLTKVFRQAEASMIIRNAHRINRGELPEVGSDPETDDCFLLGVEDSEKAADLVVDCVVNRIPRRLGIDPSQDIQVLAPMKRGDLGVGALNEKLRAAINPEKPGQLDYRGFRAGDRVMQTRNNYDLGVMNGEIGHVRLADPHAKILQVDFGGGAPVVHTAESIGELDLAYAVTIHKSQGSEYPAVVLVMHRQHWIMLQRTLFYTGLTRARQFAVVIGEDSAIERAVARRGGTRRTTALPRFLGGEVEGYGQLAIA